MNPPVVLAEEGASNAAVTGLKLPVVLAEEGASNAAVTGLSVQNHEQGPVSQPRKKPQVMRSCLDHGHTTPWKAKFPLKHQLCRDIVVAPDDLRNPTPPLLPP